MSEVEVRKVSDARDRSLPIFSEFEKVAERVRLNAWKLFSHRGDGEGHALDDWLRAEREICWPAAELTERDDYFKLKVALAGFEPKEIDVTATPTEIMIKAAHEQEDSGEKEDGLKWSEFRSNDVYRRIEFPSAVNTDEITAKFKNGLLQVRAPKHLTPEEAVEKIEFDAPS
jgi:HSP20 family protein